MKKESATKVKNKVDFNKYFMLSFATLAVGIIAYIIFKYPQCGVADQGDFDRVMFGLSLLDSDSNNPNFVRFYNYIVTDYQINTTIISNVLTVCGSTINYFIIIIIYICKLLGQEVFKTQYLAIAYSIMYIFSICTILKEISFNNKIKMVLIGFITLFVFFDGNYIVWFNSLYGEPVMLSTLVLFIATYLMYINCKYRDDNKEKLNSRIIFVFLAAFLFMGAKMQVSTTLPFILFLLGKIIWDNRKELSRKYKIAVTFILLLVIITPIKMSIQGSAQGKDTLYNSVFYGVLNESETPEQDLIDLGLNPDMAGEAGKHAYLPADEYVKYVPRTEIVEQEFYSKMGNSKLAKFYLTHPLRLLKGMEYTANKTFITSTSLGKNYRSDSEEPVREFNRFTEWSSFRESKFPEKLWFVLAVYLIAVAVTIYEFIKNRYNKRVKNIIFLIWGVMLSGAIQFPMPFVGNGRADTAKQLFLFNFIFDILIVGIVSFIICKVVDVIRKGRIKNEI